MDDLTIKDPQHEERKTTESENDLPTTMPAGDNVNTKRAGDDARETTSATAGLEYVTEEKEEYIINDAEEDDENDGESGTDAENADTEFEEEDEEDYDDMVTFPSQRIERRPSTYELPDTVTILETESGGKVYLLGTAHFSQESQNDVKKVIEETQPDVVVVELCPSRINILKLDETTLLEEASNINLTKIRAAIKQGGLIQGIMHLLLLNMSAHLTKQLGMAPGGEFRMAFQQARRILGCRLQLGDRPIQVTLKRAFASLSWWQRIRLAWYMITCKDPISAEQVEKCKQKDLLEEMLREMTGEFPHISRVFVEERDLYLAYSLNQAAHPIPPIDPDKVSAEWIPAVVVGVVGIGHVGGIVKNWNTVTSAHIADIMQVPPGSAFGSLFRWSIRGAVIGLISYAFYAFFTSAHSYITN